MKSYRAILICIVSFLVYQGLRKLLLKMEPCSSLNILNRVTDEIREDIVSMDFAQSIQRMMLR